MVLTTLSNFSGLCPTAACSCLPESADLLLDAAKQAEFLAVCWDTLPEPEILHDLSGLSSRLLVPVSWQSLLPQAGLLVSSSISGGDLRQRFQTLADRRCCWLVPERLCRQFPLPCPDGQGFPLSEIPRDSGFYSEALGCRYVHRPQNVILFDTEETLEYKIHLAQECGFLGVFSTETLNLVQTGSP